MQCLLANPESNDGDDLAYVNKRSGKNGAERFTGVYKAADGSYKSSGTFDTEERALEVAEAAERHVLLRLAETSPADKATVTLAAYIETFLGSHDIEANSKETYARHLSLHVIPYIGKQRVAEVSRETIHRLLTVVLKEEGASQTTILHTRTALSSMMQMAWDNGYRKDNPVRGSSSRASPRNQSSWPRRISSSASTTRCRISPRRYSPVSGSPQARDCAN